MAERARDGERDERGDDLVGSRPRPVSANEPGMAATLRASPGSSGGSLEPGTVIEGTYRVIDLLGQGAMGAVYLVEHVALGKRFAAKVVAGSAGMDPAAVVRLRNEARMASAIDHEHIVGVTHLGSTANGNVFVVMELLRGEDLRARTLAQRELAARGEGDPWLPDVEVRAIVAPILSALEAAHAAGIVHRDLKPENVFLHQRQGRIVPKIVDFGIGKLRTPDGASLRLTATGQIVGTPLYMAPEQSRSTELVDHRADVYAVGVMTFELLTGRLPFEASHLYEIVVKHATEPPPDPRSLRPGLPDAVAELVLRCLAKSPDDRYQSASELLAAWEAAWGDASVPVLAAPAASASASGPRSIPPRLPAESSSAATIAAAPPVAPASDVASASSALRPDPAPARGVRPLAVVGALAVLGLVAGLSWWMGSSAGSRAPSTPAPAAPLGTSAPETAADDDGATAGPELPAAVEEVGVEAPVTLRRRIVSEPAGAEVVRDGAVVGVTPFELDLLEGESVVVELRRRGHRSVSERITSESPETVQVRLPRREPTGSYPELAPR